MFKLEPLKNPDIVQILFKEHPNPHLSAGALDFLISTSGFTSSNSELVALRFRLPGFNSNSSSRESPELWRLWDLPMTPALLNEMLLLLWQESLSPREGLGRRGSISGLPLSASTLTTVSNLSWKSDNVTWLLFWTERLPEHPECPAATSIFFLNVVFTWTSWKSGCNCNILSERCVYLTSWMSGCNCNVLSECCVYLNILDVRLKLKHSV